MPNKAYELLTEDETRSCDAISEEACKEVPGNFSWIVANGSLTKLAEQLISPKVTLPWLFDFLMVPQSLLGLIVPIRDAGSLLPQLAVAGFIRSRAKRKWFWVGAAIVQALAMFASIWALTWESPMLSGLWILFMLLVFSIASGVGSVSFKDVSAKVIPKGQRGQMLAARSWIGGILGLAAGAYLIFFVKDKSELLFTVLFGAAGFLWLGGAFTYSMVKEYSGAMEGGRTPIQSWKSGVAVFKRESNFRRFIYTRALLMALPLSIPFMVSVGRSVTDGAFSALGALIVATGLAQVVSSNIWGIQADKSAPRVMLISSLVAVGSVLYVVIFPYFPDSWQSVWTFAPALFTIGVAYSGAKISRKTYLMDIAPSSDRPTWVSMANTSMGIATLVAAGIGTLAALWDAQIQLVLYSVLILGGGMLSQRLSNNRTS
ncbi:MFS transporter [Phaeocystidibacter luteus]|uniref:MFS transporter n=1 Tax=Phaeocystidibacter luteus TaxID=911197 RepID=A0A6N6RHY9_9FLAO|nr:MFS transporter [Phaeocystidibacter luteus]KAB2809964.1 MFS transporter [Phaeocystidibacter luteus]